MIKNNFGLAWLTCFRSLLLPHQNLILIKTCQARNYVPRYILTPIEKGVLALGSLVVRYGGEGPGCLRVQVLGWLCHWLAVWQREVTQLFWESVFLLVEWRDWLHDSGQLCLSQSTSIVITFLPCAGTVLCSGNMAMKETHWPRCQCTLGCARPQSQSTASVPVWLACSHSSFPVNIRPVCVSSLGHQFRLLLHGASVFLRLVLFPADWPQPKGEYKTSKNAVEEDEEEGRD